MNTITVHSLMSQLLNCRATDYRVDVTVNLLKDYFCQSRIGIFDFRKMFQAKPKLDGRKMSERQMTLGKTKMHIDDKEHKKSPRLNDQIGNTSAFLRNQASRY